MEKTKKLYSFVKDNLNKLYFYNKIYYAECRMQNGGDDHLIDSTIGKISRPRNLTNWVYETLEEAIINHSLKPGEEIPEYKLAEMLGISNTPVREALNRLTADGLVIKERNKAPRVIVFSRREIEELYSIRAVLEGFAIASAVKMAMENDIQILEDLQTRGETYCRKGLIDEYKKYHRQFHDMILSLSQNNLLIQMMVAINKKVRFCLSTTVLIPGRMERGVEEHRKMVDYFKTKDSEKAKELMEQHILLTKDAYIEKL